MGDKSAAADIIIPVRNQFAQTRNLVEGIYRHTDIPFHIFLVDNGSTDATADLHKIYTRNITVVRNQNNRGWQSAVNQGISMGNNPYVVFLENGVEVSKGWLGNLVAFLETHPKIGAVGPLNSNTKDLQCVDRVREQLVPEIPQFLTDDLHERNRILRYHFNRTGILIEGRLASFCVVLNRRVINKVGLLDESFMSCDDDDYCRRLRETGYVLGLSLDTYIIHSNHARKAVSAEEALKAST